MTKHKELLSLCVEILSTFDERNCGIEDHFKKSVDNPDCTVCT